MTLRINLNNDRLGMSVCKFINQLVVYCCADHSIIFAELKDRERAMAKKYSVY